MLIVSIILAYLFCGYAQVTKDLNENPVNAPVWTFKPTMGMYTIVLLFWPYVQLTRSSTQDVRSIAHSLIGVLSQLMVLTVFVYGCLSLSAYLTEILVLQVIVFVFLAFIGSFFVVPILMLAMIPIMLLAGVFLDLIFPNERK